MQIQESIVKTIESANGRAIATVGADGVNVVPVSMVRVHNNEIWLFNFFMSKTVENVKTNPQVALSCWHGLEGVQVKGEVVYETEGDRFKEAVAWVATKNPDRVVKGLLRLIPKQAYNISAGANAGEEIQ